MIAAGPGGGGFAGVLLGDPAGVTRCVKSDSTAPVEWYVRHITGCLVGFASRVNVNTFGVAFERLRQCAEAYMPNSAFAARVNAELIRLGGQVPKAELSR